VPTKKIKVDSVWKKGALVAAGVACIVGSFFFAKWGMANSAVTRPADADVAVYLTELAPDDYQTHYVAAILLEKSFAPQDIERALKEYEAAAALTPNHYLMWLDLGRARERSGDREGAERALRRAIELAPNYSRVQWALGNSLLRQGRRDEAFAEIIKSVNSDTTFATPAANLAWQFFDGDIGQIRNSLGASPLLDGALASLLAREKRLDQALVIWDAIPAGEKQTRLKESGAALFGKLMEVKRFRDAMRVWNELQGRGNATATDTVTNGGFEEPVKLEGAGPFEWQIAQGLQPQIVLSSGQKHGGNNSLLLIFNSTDAKDFRTISKLISIEPNTEHELEIFYSSDLKSAATFKWEVVDAHDAHLIAATEPLVSKPGWNVINLRFKSPATDGVILRFAREGCGQVCNVTGNLSFDDISIRRVTQ
jgi:Flp pilus assembly protein TadD